MSEDLISRLKHFEQNQIKLNDKYGAEVLYHAYTKLIHQEAAVAALRKVKLYTNFEWERESIDRCSDIVYETVCSLCDGIIGISEGEPEGHTKDCLSEWVTKELEEVNEKSN